MCETLYERGLKHIPELEDSSSGSKMKQASRGVKLTLDKMDYNTILLAIRYFEREIYMPATEIQMHPVAYHDLLLDPANNFHNSSSTTDPNVNGVPIKVTTTVDQHELIIFAR